MSHSTYDELEWHIKRLIAARSSGNLVFVLGSGINAEYNLPDWFTLLRRLIEASGRLHVPRNIRPKAAEFRDLLNYIIADPLLQGAAARAAFSDPEQWTDAIRARLVPRRARTTDPAKPLRRIAHIVAEQHHHHPDRHIPVLTFNYDDLLETALRKELGRSWASVLTSVASEETFSLSRRRSGITVYHLHGHVEDRFGDIVLDAASYVSVLAAPGHHWSWECMHAYLFREDSAALFLGLSLLDPSLRLLLTESASKAMPLSGVFVSKPFPAIAVADLRKARAFAHIAREIRALFDEVLSELSLIPYHVSSWEEVNDLLEIVGA